VSSSNASSRGVSRTARERRVASRAVSFSDKTMVISAIVLGNHPSVYQIPAKSARVSPPRGARGRHGWPTHREPLSYGSKRPLEPAWGVIPPATPRGLPLGTPALLPIEDRLISGGSPRAKVDPAPADDAFHLAGPPRPHDGPGN